MNEPVSLVTIDSGSGTMDFDSSIYSVDCIQRATHALSGRAHFQLEQRGEKIIRVKMRQANTLENLEALGGELATMANDYQLRERIRKETEPIRRLLIAQAFSNVNLISPPDDPAKLGEQP